MLTLLHAHPFLIFAPFVILVLTALASIGLAAYVDATTRRPAPNAQIFYFSALKMPLRSAPVAVLTPVRRAANGG
jgi:hypothetical protein